MKIKLRTIVRLCALVLVILFFVPTTTVSCEYWTDTIEYDISPFGLATGTWNDDTENIEEIEEYTVKDDTYPVLFIMLVLSVVLVILGSKIPILGSVLTLVNIVFLYLMHFGILNYAKENYEDTFAIKQTGAFGWYVTISIIIIALLMMKQFKVFQKLQQLRKPKTADDSSADKAPQEHICRYCGVKAGDGNYYCGRCGTKL